jgi:hypothetical protein
MDRDITTGIQSPTTTGAVTGSLDTSALTGDFEICLDVLAIAAGKHARVAIEDTASATAFSDATTVQVWDFYGATAPPAQVSQSVRSYLVTATRFGVANAKLRANVQLLDSGANLQLHAWLRQ